MACVEMTSFFPTSTSSFSQVLTHHQEENEPMNKEEPSLNLD